MNAKKKYRKTKLSCYPCYKGSSILLLDSNCFYSAFSFQLPQQQIECGGDRGIHNFKNYHTTGSAIVLPVVSPTRIFKNPCHRCRLAKLFDCQWVAGDKEAARAARDGDFALINHSKHWNQSFQA